MQSPEVRWVLAFDASCGTCREVSRAVREASGDRLEVLPLAHPDVRRWRELSIGSDAPNVPTLIRVAAERGTAWTGPRMGPVLARRLGVRSTLAVLRALGRLREQPQLPGAERGGLRRSEFLRLGGGLAVAAGVLLSGRTPALAGAPTQTEAQAWVAAHLSELPQRYEDVVALPVAYRKEVFRASSPEIRSRLWTDQLSRYRGRHRGSLSADRVEVLDRAIRLASKPSTFTRNRGLRDGELPELDAVKTAGEHAFGRDAAFALFGTLAAVPDGTNAVAEWPPICPCATESDWCDDGMYCDYALDYLQCCVYGGEACGTFWAYDCNGKCMPHGQTCWGW